MIEADFSGACCDRAYWCPASGEIECYTHGGGCDCDRQHEHLSRKECDEKRIYNQGWRDGYDTAQTEMDDLRWQIVLLEGQIDKDNNRLV